MNLERLKAEEARFFISYPGGFKDPKMEAVSKRHNISRFVKLVEEDLCEEAFSEPNKVIETVSKIIKGSSLVSVFEKTAFRNMLNEIDPIETMMLSDAFKQLLYGDRALGFELAAKILGKYKNFKWPIITAVLYYSNPKIEFLVKPTTAKKAIEYFELEDLKYVSKPSYEFYSKYRDAINALKAHVSPELQVENGPFCGFLMYAVGLYE